MDEDELLNTNKKFSGIYVFPAKKSIYKISQGADLRFSYLWFMGIKEPKSQDY